MLCVKRDLKKGKKKRENSCGLPAVLIRSWKNKIPGSWDLPVELIKKLDVSCNGFSLSDQVLTISKGLEKSMI